MIVTKLFGGLFLLASLASSRFITKRACTYSVTAATGDTCSSLSGYWGITEDQFVSYNPSVGSGCSSGVVPGQKYCVEWDNGAAPTTATPTTTTTTTHTTTSTGLPSPTQSGLISTCTSFYKVVSGDTCQKIVDKHGTFSLDNFYSWNPAVGTDCSALQVNVYVCVGIPGTPTAKPTTTGTAGAPPSPTQSGLTSDCTAFYKVVSGDTCQKVVDKFGTFTLDNFYSWNPAVGTDCSGLQLNVYVCVGVKGTPTAKPTTTTGTGNSAPAPTQSGLTSDCTAFYKVVSGDTCQKIVDKYGTFTLDNFYAWNPAIGTDCSSLQLNVYVCVGVKSTPTAKPTNTAPSPTQSGLVSTCKTFYKVSSGDTCEKIVNKYGTFSLSDFYSWNPAVGTDCSGLQLGVYVCVGVPGTPTAPVTTPTKTATPSGPTPTQPGIISSCNNYYMIKSGDNCVNIVAAYHNAFTLQQFYSWNPSVGSDCSSLWGGYYVCVGVRS